MVLTGKTEVLKVGRITREVAICRAVNVTMNHPRKQIGMTGSLVGGFIDDHKNARYVVRYEGGFYTDFSGEEIERWNGRQRLMAEIIEEPDQMPAKSQKPAVAQPSETVDNEIDTFVKQLKTGLQKRDK